MSIKQLKENVSDDDLANAKVSLRVDPDDNFDDDLIKMLIKASRRDIIEQVGEQIDDYFDSNAIFDAAVLIEVGHLYNHRDSTSAQQEYEVPMALYSLINAMKDDYRYLMFAKDDSSSAADAEKQEKDDSDKQAVDSSTGEQGSGEQK